MSTEGENQHTRPRAWRRWIDPLRAAVDQGIAPLDVLAFEDSLSAMAGASDAAFAKQLLATTKAVHQDMRQNLQDALLQSGDGAVYVGRHSWGMDLLLGTVMRTLCTRHGAEDVVLIAVGGYGRGELAPNSDIDLLVLTEKDSASAADVVVEQMLYLLWDLGLKVGHAKRTVTTTMRAAREDLFLRKT